MTPCNREMFEKMLKDLDEDWAGKLNKQVRKSSKPDGDQGKVRVEVADAHAQPRTTKLAEMMDIKSGFVMVLATSDEHGKPWNLSMPGRRREALKMQEDQVC